MHISKGGHFGVDSVKNHTKKVLILWLANFSAQSLGPLGTLPPGIPLVPPSGRPSKGRAGSVLILCLLRRATSGRMLFILKADTRKETMFWRCNGEIIPICC